MEIGAIKKEVIEGNNGRDPFSDPLSWQLIEQLVPEQLWSMLTDPAGNAQFVEQLPLIFPAESILGNVDQQTCWERIGNFYKNQNRYHEAISIYHPLYHQLIRAQA